MIDWKLTTCKTAVSQKIIIIKAKLGNLFTKYSNLKSEYWKSGYHKH